MFAGVASWCEKLKGCALLTFLGKIASLPLHEDEILSASIFEYILG